ncbi:hypothetical protein [Tautonia rosea]|uniref:hypothetical protein n=1 Tax=Tautonia rosea TaxID=2728037 RepID=UPI0014756BF2|nr:hypothetical protein [Tautonia rosea]
MAAEALYYPEVRCKVIPGGLLPDGVAARVQDISGRSQFVQVTPALINEYGDDQFLSVGIVEIDRRQRRVLIELPAEADSGANRMWVAFESLRHEVAKDSGAVA